MIQMIAAAGAALMILFVTLRGLRPRARWHERAYTAAASGWSAFGAAIYYPAVLGRFAPIGWLHSPTLVTVFGFGLILLGVLGASLMTGGES